MSLKKIPLQSAFANIATGYTIIADSNGDLTGSSSDFSGSSSILLFRDFIQKQGISVQGTWAWTANASQTMYVSVTSEGAGNYNNTTTNNLDEYKWANVFLPKGNYKITLLYFTGSDGGVAEILFGATSIGTVDMYNNPSTYNLTWSPTFSLASSTTADIRFRANGHNGSSSAYRVGFSRFQIEKTG